LFDINELYQALKITYSKQTTVIPAQAGIFPMHGTRINKIPACAGMTVVCRDWVILYKDQYHSETAAGLAA
jgi:hypothetical protein